MIAIGKALMDVHQRVKSRKDTFAHIMAKFQFALSVAEMD